MAHTSPSLPDENEITAELPIFRFMRTIRPDMASVCHSNEAGALGPGIYCSIMVLNSVMERAGNRKLEAHNLTISQWLALGAVLHCGAEGLSHGQLGQRMMLSKAPVTGLVDRLARAGLVERHADEHDRRVSRVVITPDGEAMWKRAHETITSSSKNDMLDSLSEDQQNQLLHLLSHLLSSFAAQDPHVAELVENARTNAE